jgi:hypothetical protein
MRIIYILFLSQPQCFSRAQQQRNRRKNASPCRRQCGLSSRSTPDAANDAGLIAQTLQAAGFDVVGARDLDQDALRRSFRDFLDKATGSGPIPLHSFILRDTGYSLKARTYLVPIDARIARDTDVAASALRASDYLRPLAALKLKASIVVFDAARPSRLRALARRLPAVWLWSSQSLVCCSLTMPHPGP